MTMKNRAPWALLAFLASCGGGGSADSTSISVSTTVVSFDGEVGAAPPSAQTVHVAFQGDGVVVGYPPGVSAPSWLSVTELGHTPTSLDVSLRLSSTTSPGTRTTTLRFATGKADGSQVKYADVQVTCTLVALPTSLTLSTGAVTFRAERGAAVPAAQGIQVAFEGDPVVVGRPPGASAPSWLSVSEGARTATSLLVSLAVTETAAAGTRTATVRFTTGRAGSLVKYADVEVTYTVATPFGATAPSMTFSALGGAAQPPQPAAGYTVAVQGDDARWRATASAPWLLLSATSGTGPGSLSVTADAAGLPAGSHRANLVVADDASGRQQSFGVTLTVRAPRLTAPAAAAFAVDPGSGPGALTQQLTVSDEIAGTSAAWAVSWSLQSVSADWVQWSPAAGSSSPSTPVTLSIDATKLLALGNGSHAANVVLSFANADAAGQTLVIPVTLTVCLPRADLVAPYLATADQGGHLYVRGAGFACTGPTPRAFLGTNEVTRTVDSDDEMQVDFPALAAGRYALRLDNRLGIQLGNAELLVLAAPGLAYRAISAPSTRGRLVYDGERETLYAVNRTDQSIERYARSGGAWSALDPLVVPSVRDVDLSPDGRTLLVAAAGSLGEVDLTAAPPTVVQRASNPDPFCGGYFAQLAVPNSGKALVVFKLGSCSGFSRSYLYDLRSHALAQTTMLYNGIAAASADGSRIYMGSNGVSPAPEVYVFNALDNSTVRGPVNYNLSAVSVSGNASRVILQGVDVYSRSLSLTGHLPPGGGAAASRDSSRAFVYRDDGTAGPRIEIYDLNGALTTGALYPLAKTVALADSPNTAVGRRVELASTPDGSAVFVSGDARILVVPVN